jgi:hypothetical protein
MLLKIADSWGPGLGAAVLALLVLAVVGVVAIVTGIVLLVVKLFRRKDRKPG